MTELSNEQLQRRRLSRQRFAWIERILLDPSISHLQFRVAILINNKYLNGTSGDAWPSQEQLAADLGLALRTIQYALDALVMLVSFTVTWLAVAAFTTVTDRYLRLKTCKMAT